MPFELSDATLHKLLKECWGRSNSVTSAWKCSTIYSDTHGNDLVMAAAIFTPLTICFWAATIRLCSLLSLLMESSAYSVRPVCRDNLSLRIASHWLPRELHLAQYTWRPSSHNCCQYVDEVGPGVMVGNTWSMNQGRDDIYSLVDLSCKATKESPRFRIH